MELVNETPLPAALVPSAEADDTMRVLCVVGYTCRVEEGALRPTRAQRPLVLDPGTELAHDVSFLRTCASVTVTGAVFPPGGEAARALAELRVGERRAQVVAVGARVWREGLGGLTPTTPIPFSALPMEWANAYGGTVLRPAALVDHGGKRAIMPPHAAGCAENLGGRGFYVDAGEALGRPLPGLEDPEHPITAWDQRPEPVCFAPYPLRGALRAAFVPASVRAALVARRAEHAAVPRLQLDPHFLRRAQEAVPSRVSLAELGWLESRGAPRQTFDALPPGTRVVLLGMRPRGEALSFHVPPPPVRLRLAIGPREQVLTPVIEAAEVDAQAREVRFVYRALFSYPLVKAELRRAVVEPTAELPPRPVD